MFFLFNPIFFAEAWQEYAKYSFDFLKLHNYATENM